MKKSLSPESDPDPGKNIIKNDTTNPPKYLMKNPETLFFSSSVSIFLKFTINLNKGIKA